MVRTAMKDSHPHIAGHGIRLAETLLQKGDASFVTDIKALRSDPDPTVVLQALCTSKLLNWPNWKPEAQATLVASTSFGVREIGSQLLAGSAQDLRRLHQGTAQATRTRPGKLPFSLLRLPRLRRQPACRSPGVRARRWPRRWQDPGPSFRAIRWFASS